MATQRQQKRLARRIRQARRKGTSSRKPQDPQIGYFAYHGFEALCDGPGCIIAGSRNAMQRLVQRVGEQDRMTIKGTTFSEIWRGLQQGSAYCFDEQAYERFRGLAREAGLSLEKQDFSDPGPFGVHLLLIQLIT